MWSHRGLEKKILRSKRLYTGERKKEIILFSFSWGERQSFHLERAHDRCTCV